MTLAAWQFLEIAHTALSGKVWGNLRETAPYSEHFCADDVQNIILKSIVWYTHFLLRCHVPLCITIDIYHDSFFVQNVRTRASVHSGAVCCRSQCWALWGCLYRCIKVCANIRFSAVRMQMVWKCVTVLFWPLQCLILTRKAIMSWGKKYCFSLLHTVNSS